MLLCVWLWSFTAAGDGEKTPSALVSALTPSLHSLPLCTHSLSALVWEMMKSPYGKIQCDLSKRQKGHMESVKWMKANDYLNLYLINNHLSHNIMDTISHFPLTQAGWQRLYCFLRQLYGRVCLKGSLRCALNCSEPVKALLRSLDLDDNTFLEILSVWNNAIGMV